MSVVIFIFWSMLCYAAHQIGEVNQPGFGLVTGTIWFLVTLVCCWKFFLNEDALASKWPVSVLMYGSFIGRCFYLYFVPLTVHPVVTTYTWVENRGVIKRPVHNVLGEVVRIPKFGRMQLRSIGDWQAEIHGITFDIPQKFVEEYIAQGVEPETVYDTAYTGIRRRLLPDLTMIPESGLEFRSKVPAMLTIGRHAFPLRGETNIVWRYRPSEMEFSQNK